MEATNHKRPISLRVTTINYEWSLLTGIYFLANDDSLLECTRPRSGRSTSRKGTETPFILLFVIISSAQWGRPFLSLCLYRARRGHIAAPPLLVDIHVWETPVLLRTLALLRRSGVQRYDLCVKLNFSLIYSYVHTCFFPQWRGSISRKEAKQMK